MLAWDPIRTHAYSKKGQGEKLYTINIPLIDLEILEHLDKIIKVRNSTKPFHPIYQHLLRIKIIKYFNARPAVAK